MRKKFLVIVVFFYVAVIAGSQLHAQNSVVQEGEFGRIKNQFVYKFSKLPFFRISFNVTVHFRRISWHSGHLAYHGLTSEKYY